jgi:hypothetical protein
MPPLSFPSLGELSAPTRALFSAFLITIGFGYLSALFLLYSAEIQPYAAQGVSMVQGLQMKYHGSRGMTRLEAELKGSMAPYATPAQREEIIQWIHDGATAAGFEKIKPILASACAQCHSGNAGSIVPLVTYQQVRKRVVFDDGQSFAQLASDSHIHLFGMSFIFLLTGAIFTLSRLNATAKLCVLVMPYVAIWADVGSWWLTKLQPLFAYVVLIGGTLMGISMAVQILLPLWQMWIRPAATPLQHAS